MVMMRQARSQQRNIIAIDGDPHWRKVREDALPENLHYRDDGCDIHPRCLTCPLPRCRYEEPGGLRSLLNQDRDSRIRTLRRQGLSVEELARRFQVSRRTVFRVLEKMPRSSPQVRKEEEYKHVGKHG